jgi:cell division protein FtsN
VWKDLMKATNVLEASNSVLMKFEKPANQGESVQKKRASYGQEYYDKYKTQTIVKEEKKYYRVQVGAFVDYENAQKMRKKVIADGFPCILKDIDGYYKCQIGAYSVKANAQSMLKKAQAAGYSDAYITYC